MNEIRVTKYIDLTKASKKAADIAVLAVAKVGAGKAKALAPVDMGELRNSIYAENIGSGKARYGASASYAQYVEFGSRPHTAPISALEGWAKRNGVPVGAVWMSIKKKGTKPQPFLRRSADMLRSEASSIFARFFKRGLHG